MTVRNRADRFGAESATPGRVERNRLGLYSGSEIWGSFGQRNLGIGAVEEQGVAQDLD